MAGGSVSLDRFVCSVPLSLTVVFMLEWIVLPPPRGTQVVSRRLDEDSDGITETVRPALS